MSLSDQNKSQSVLLHCKAYSHETFKSKFYFLFDRMNFTKMVACICLGFLWNKKCFTDKLISTLMYEKQCTINAENSAVKSVNYRGLKVWQLRTIHLDTNVQLLLWKTVDWSRTFKHTASKVHEVLPHTFIFSCRDRASTAVQISLCFLEHLAPSLIQRSRNECPLWTIARQEKKTQTTLSVPNIHIR